MKTVTAFGDFSTVGFTMVGLGEPRFVRAGVVGGSYFNVMGLRIVRGRLIDASDDGPNAAGVAVLTHRFWTAGLGSDPNVIGKTVRLGMEESVARSATIIGILEPSVPYPEEFLPSGPRRIVVVAADIDDENIVPGPTMTIYHPSGQYGFGGRLFVHTRTENPYALAPSITRLIHQMSAEQVVGRAATLDDVRAEALAPDRLNALVFGGFALVALTIAIVGVAAARRACVACGCRAGAAIGVNTPSGM